MNEKKALAGPYIAVLADRDGFVYDSETDARENTLHPDNEAFKISVRRGTAAALRKAGIRHRLPAGYHLGDVAYEITDVYLNDPDDSITVAARYVQAQAMAAGLNAAAGDVR